MGALFTLLPLGFPLAVLTYLAILESPWVQSQVGVVTFLMKSEDQKVCFWNAAGTWAFIPLLPVSICEMGTLLATSGGGPEDGRTGQLWEDFGKHKMLRGLDSRKPVPG